VDIELGDFFRGVRDEFTTCPYIQYLEHQTIVFTVLYYYPDVLIGLCVRFHEGLTVSIVAKSFLVSSSIFLSGLAIVAGFLA
jgi:hypothetical protein